MNPQSPTLSTKEQQKTTCNAVKSFLASTSNVLMLQAVVVKVILFSIMLSLHFRECLVICDSVNTLFTIIAFVIIIIRKKVKFIIKWVVYFIYMATQLIVSFTSKRKEDKQSDGSIIDNEDYILVNYLICNLYIQNSFIFIGRSQVGSAKKGLFIQLVLLLCLNILSLAIINVTQKQNAIYESLTFIYCFLVAHFYYFHINSIGSDKGSPKDKGDTLDGCNLPSDYEEQMTIYGSCIVNKQLMIKHHNAHFKLYMQDIAIRSSEVSPVQREAADDHQSIKTTSNHYCSGLFVSVSQVQLPLSNKQLNNNRNGCLNDSNNKLCVNYMNLMAVDDEGEEASEMNSCSSPNKVNLLDVFTMKFLSKDASPSAVAHIVLQGDPELGSFILLGKFRFLSLINDGQYYEVYCRTLAKQKTKGSDDTLYELAFYKLSERAQKNKAQIEKKYKSLLLRKINHEFKVPIVLIQNMINEINETTTSIYTKSIAKTIKYVTEVILLLVSDLTEYIHLNSLEVENKEMKAESGTVDLFSFFHDIKNICFVYAKVYNTNVAFQYEFHPQLKNCSIAINETKLKQILSVIIINAIKNSSNVTIKMIAKDNPKQFLYLRSNSKSLLRKNSILKPSPTVQSANESKNSLSNPQGLTKVEFAQDFKLSICIEDNGPGINRTLLNSLNSFYLNDQANFGYSPDFFSEESKGQKGFGTGFLICLKLCKDLNILLQCELICQEQEVKGTRFTLDMDYKITQDEERRNDSCIYEHEIESSNYGLTNQSIATKQVDLNDLILNLNDNDKINQSFSDLSNQSITITCNGGGNKASRKSKTCLFFKSKFETSPPQEDIRFTVCQQSSFNINGVIGQRRVSKNSDVPLFNDYDEEFSRSIDKYSLPPSMKKRSSLYQINYSNQLIGGGGSPYLESKTSLPFKGKTSVSNNICILKEMKNERSTSSQVISLFNENYRLIKNRNQPKNDLEAKDCIKSSNSSTTEKNQIVIVDDIDSNKRAIYLMVKKHLDKKDKGDLYDYRLLSDGVELVNLFYNDTVTHDNLIKLIFCDESMNFLNGSDAFGMIKKIASAYNVKTIPFILCSAYCDNSFKEKMLSIGIEKVYGKPLQSSSVERIIEDFSL